MDTRPRGASKNDLGDDGQLGGWHPASAAFQSYVAGACKPCGRGRRDRRRSCARRLVNFFGSGRSKRSDTDWLFSRDVSETRTAPDSSIIRKPKAIWPKGADCPNTMRWTRAPLRTEGGRPNCRMVVVRCRMTMHRPRMLGIQNRLFPGCLRERYSPSRRRFE